MRENNCDLIRRELDELMLDEACSASALKHLNECAACREFHQTQTKLRRMVGGLGTVTAPADFDFRLRARLADGPANGAFHYWTVVQRGLAVAAVVIVLGFGVVVIRNLMNQPKPAVAVQNPPRVQPQPPVHVETKQANTPTQTEGLTARGPANIDDKSRNERPASTGTKSKRTLTAIDFSKQRAEVISGSEAAGSEAAIFPIDASLQPLKLSLDDGRGNAKTISVPTVRFGSQKMLPNANQFAQKGIW